MGIAQGSVESESELILYRVGLFAKLASPPFCGARRKMIKIKNPLNSNQSIFNIE